MNNIPGSEILGYGFNILGEYDSSSVTSQLFIHKTMDAQKFTYPPTNLTYQVPDNTSVFESTHTSGATQVFNTQQQFQSFFSAKAGLSGSYGGFKGEFNMAYSQTLNTEESYYYCLSESNYTGWQLFLASQSTQWVSDDFLEDGTVQNLPAHFTTNNQEQFFEVFRKFGTHFVSKVTVGGNMNYFVAVEKSFTSNEQQVQSNLSLEYKAVFFSAQADAEAEWKQLGQSWSDSRIVKVDSSGGDTSVLNALTPSYGDSDSNIFVSWSKAVMQNPAIVDFSLTPLSALFTGDTANAVSAALNTYLNGAILANANADLTPARGPQGGDYTTSSSIIVAGNVITPNPFVPVPTPIVWHWTDPDRTVVVPIGGFQVALFNPNTLQPIMSHIYYVDNTSMDTKRDIYPEMLKDILAVTTSNYFAVLAAFGVDLIDYPSSDFVTWLASCGAALSGWKKYIDFCGSPGMCSYVMIGKKGLMPGNATENFAMTSDWADYGSEASVDVSAEVMLYDNPYFNSLLKKYGAPSNFGIIHAG